MSTSSWTSERVLHEAQIWTWAPPGWGQFERDWGSGLWQPQERRMSIKTTADLDVEYVWRAAIAEATKHSVQSVSWAVSDTSRPRGIEHLLLDAEAELTHTTEVMAWDIADRGVPHVVASLGVQAHLVDTPQRADDADEVSRDVWGGEPPPASEIAQRDAQLRQPIRERSEFRVVAYRDTTPISAGGVTFAGRVARMWGAGTVASGRGQGLPSDRRAPDRARGSARRHLGVG